MSTPCRLKPRRTNDEPRPKLTANNCCQNDDRPDSRGRRAKITGIPTSSANDMQYPHWQCQPQSKTLGLDNPQPY